ncbi:MAG TPA: hypothetical protein VID51_08400 [Solirubrobacterales bacterium]
MPERHLPSLARSKLCGRSAAVVPAHWTPDSFVFAESPALGALAERATEQLRRLEALHLKAVALAL